jgi:hypothetical protein
MESSYTGPAYDPKIVDLLQIIDSLSNRYKQSWIKLRKVAKELEGSEEFEPLIYGYAEIAKSEGWVALTSNQKNIMLTEEGRKVISSSLLIPQKQSETEKIAKAVKKYAARLERQTLRIESVMTVARAGGKFVQALSINLDENSIMPQTPVEFRPQGGGAMTRGLVVAQDEDGGIVYVAFDSEVLEINLPAILSVDRAFLLNQLATSLDKLEAYPPLAAPIFNQETKGFPIAKENSREVADMLAYLRPPWTRFLWGPPGAGKSYALGRLAVNLLERDINHRMLVVAPSNMAVDVTMSQIVSHLEESNLKYLIEDRKILRYGYPRNSDVLERSEILGTPILDEQTRKIRRLSSRIKVAEHKKVSDKEIAILRTELFAAQEELKRLVNDHVSNCSIVATTTTLAYLPSSPIGQQSWDTILVDEVTMVPPAQCVYLSSLGKSRLLLAGDPRQLGPVYEERKDASKEDYEWMGRDIFDKGGISSGEGEARSIATGDMRLARITSQRRCSDDIWRRVAYLYPQVANRSDKEINLPICGLPPKPGEGAVLMDVGTTGENAKCELVHRSWRNQYTASLALEIAYTIAAEASEALSIAIISPYRAQTKLLQQWLRDEKRSENPFVNSIKAGTIHQFQGSEADIVIFDMVDGVGRNGLGKLLKGDIGLRLTNVAFTRARGKLIVIANSSWCKNKMQRNDNPLLWDYVVGANESQNVKVIPPLRSKSGDKLFDRTESPIERDLLEAMLQLPKLSEVKAQHVIRDSNDSIISRADFAFPSLNYAVYCDGAQWHLQHDRWQMDLRQRNRLTELGWTYSVYSGRQIMNDADGCAEQIKNIVSRLEKLAGIQSDM